MYWFLTKATVIGHHTVLKLIYKERSNPNKLGQAYYLYIILTQHVPSVITIMGLCQLVQFCATCKWDRMIDNRKFT